MSEVVDGVEIEMEVFHRKNRVCVAHISDECFIGLVDTTKMFLDVGNDMVGVNGKVLPVCFKYVGGEEVPF